MSEMEFEKACRGANTLPVANEYAWGNTTATTISQQPGTIIFFNIGAYNETPAFPYNNTRSGYISRVGIFARNTGSTRTLSGGTYYGIMNMSDNVKEVVVSVVNPEGRSFNYAVHGDGYLAPDGNSDIAAWKNGKAFGQKGSWFLGNLDDARISDRININWYANNAGATDFAVGIRLVRTSQ